MDVNNRTPSRIGTMYSYLGECARTSSGPDCGWAAGCAATRAIVRQKTIGKYRSPLIIKSPGRRTRGTHGTHGTHGIHGTHGTVARSLLHSPASATLPAMNITTRLMPLLLAAAMQQTAPVS